MASRCRSWVVVVCIVLGAMSLMWGSVQANGQEHKCCATSLVCEGFKICCDPDLLGAYPCSGDNNVDRGYCRASCTKQDN